MKKYAINVYYYRHYQPAQDALAELFSSEHHELVREPDNTQMPPHDYVKVILDEMLRIERHWQRGRRLKLEPEVVILHDEIYGVVPRQFDKGVLQAARELYDYMDTEVQGRMMLEGYDPYSSLQSQQPESVRRMADKVLGALCSSGFGWSARGSSSRGSLNASMSDVYCRNGLVLKLPTNLSGRYVTVPLVTKNLYLAMMYWTSQRYIPVSTVICCMPLCK